MTTRARMLNILTGVLVMVCLAVCLMDWFQVSGRRYGMFYGVIVDPPPSGFAVHGPNYYQSINTWYFIISICTIVFFAARLLGSAVASVGARILTLCVAVISFVNMLSYKYDVMTVKLPYEWLEISIYLDWWCLITMAIVMCLEMIRLIPGRAMLRTVGSGYDL